MSSDLKKTRKQLMEELDELRQEVRKLESGSIDPDSAGGYDGSFTGIFDGIKDGLVKLDRIGSIVDVNKAAADIFGGSKKDLIGKHFTKIGIFSLADIPSLLSKFKRLVAGNESDSVVTIKNKNGLEFHLDCRTSIIKSKGKPASLLVVVRDVTERKKAEQQLLLERHKLVDVVDNMNCGLLLLDDQARVTEANLLAQKWLGKTMNIEGRTCYELFGLENPDTECAGLLAIRSGQESRGKAFTMTINGDKRHFYAAASPTLDESGHVTQVTEVIVDITEHKRAEQRLVESEEKFRNLVETSQGLIFRCDTEGRFTYLNPAWEDVLGYPADEMTGHHFSEFKPQDRNETDSVTNSQILDGKDTLGYETVYMSKSGQPKNLVFNARILRDGQGNTLGTQGTAHDITDLLRAEADLKQIEWMLAKGNAGELNGPSNEALSTQSYGDLSDLNRSRTILESVGKDLLAEISGDYIRLLDSSGAIYESNGDYALGMFSSNWCRMMDEASRKACGTDDNREALDCGKWRCHESCWNDASKVAIQTGQPVDIECAGGIRLFAVPIRSGGEIVGSMNFGYGDPPKDPETLKRLSEEYQIDLAVLTETSHSHATPPAFIVETAKGRLETSARLIGEITERKQAEEKLVQQQYYLSKAQELGIIGTWELDLRQNKLVWTDENYRIFGVPIGSQLTYEIFLNTVHPDDRKYVNQEWTAALEGKPYDIEHRLIVDGDIKWVREKADVIFDDEGQAIKGIGFSQDITEHKRVELALRDSEERFKKLFDKAPVGYQSLDEDGRFLELNQTWCTILGYSKDEVIGRCFTEFIDPAASDVFERCFPKFKAAGFINGVEHVMVKKDGSKFTASFQGRIGHNKDGSFKQTHCIFTDITERKRVELALKESEQTFRLIAERAFDMIIMIDLKGTVSYVSPSIEHVFGHAPADVIGTHLTTLIPASEHKHFNETLQITSSGRLVDNRMSRFYRKDGTIADIEINAVPIFKEDKIVGAQGIIRDITETKRLRELESRAQRLETAGQIAGQVAHDFNNLLAPLIAYPDFVRDELPSNHSAVPFLNDIERAATQIAEINQQLLTLGRRGHYCQEPLNLNEVVTDIIKELEVLPDTAICISELDHDLMNIMAGRAQIHRVLSNLVCNAKDAVADGGQITIRTENYYVDNVSINYGRVPKGEYVKLTVSDTGCGISPDVLLKVFDPFFTSKTTDKKRGSGLGLSVVDAVLKDHHGYIDAKSEVGEGTSFYLYFPITREVADVRNSNRIVGGSETLLIVDDDSIQREVSSNLLEKLGYDVISVPSGEEAIEFLKSNSRDLLVLDMIMPDGMDGTETYKKALEINPNQRAIIVSGFAEGNRVQKALDIGAGAFVRKPLTRGSIAAAVRDELDRSTKTSTHQS